MSEVSTLSAKKEPTAEERKRWWKENIDSRGYCDEELSTQDLKILKEAEIRFKSGQFTPWEEIASNLGIKPPDETKNV